jgi:hypothetical protein
MNKFNKTIQQVLLPPPLIQYFFLFYIQVNYILLDTSNLNLKYTHMK